MLFTGQETCVHGDIRFARDYYYYFYSNDHDREGLVEVCVNGAWGTICLDLFGESWGSTEAGVVCRQLGYALEGSYNNFSTDS